jgi:uncharacterized protein (TIGR00296 family)
MAISSAVRDYRFSPVKQEEIPAIKVEISVLTPLKRIQSPDEIELGKHGIYIKKGTSSGTYLPQVANSTVWTVEEFLGSCARDKAGIGWDGWKDAELYTYEAIVFGEYPLFPGCRRWLINARTAVTKIITRYSKQKMEPAADHLA